MEKFGKMFNERLNQSLHDFQKLQVKSLSQGAAGVSVLLLSLSRMSLLKNFISSVSECSPLLFRICNDFVRNLIDNVLYFSERSELDLTVDVPYSYIIIIIIIITLTD